MIELEHIVKKYSVKAPKDKGKFFTKKGKKQLTALDDVTFQANTGEIVGILGPNGAGKTTLLKIIAGLLMPEEGKGTVNGFDIFKDREKVRTSVSFLMSGGWVIFDYKFSVRDNLKYWGVYQGLGLKDVDQRIEEVLKIVDLYDKIDEYPEHLSSGMRQRMNLARCLLTDRPIYLLDEPTANVDPQSAEFIRTFVKTKLKKNNKTIILATHNLWEAEAICDRLVILNESKVLVVDKTENIKRNIGREMAILKLGSPRLNILNAVREKDYVELAMMEGNDLKVFGDVRRHLPEIMDICRASSKVEWVDIKEPSLHEIFMQLTGREKA